MDAGNVFSGANAQNAHWDWIIIDQLEFDAIIGIYPHEREHV